MDWAEDVNGNETIDGLPAAGFELLVFTEEHLPAALAVARLAPGEARKINIYLDCAPAAAEAQCSIAGRVELADGTPAAGDVDVYLIGSTVRPVRRARRVGSPRFYSSGGGRRVRVRVAKIELL